MLLDECKVALIKLTEIKLICAMEHCEIMRNEKVNKSLYT